ncbi:zinc finger protein OZF-like isoform X1 [Hyposmocoma kahamanoa]|uniref:zinc finger protein OZF-like isoform X1 n=1 Tax=Hyposmocoma kahamanoa TaxID=1477025 RepID=UPI000E6D915E|nr:zinc finger protein OZF-like isoform X1 [Hyposmocoma kahamanoa]
MSWYDEASSEDRAESPQALARPELVTVKIEQVDSDSKEPEETKQDSSGCGVPLIVKIESRLASRRHTPAANEKHNYVETMQNGGSDDADHRLLKSQSEYVLMKKQTFADVDKRVFLDLLKKYQKVMDNKRLDYETMRERNVAWNRITAGIQPQSVHHDSGASAAAVPFRNECPVCRKTLATPSGLQRHLANHSRESFACRVCYRQFFKQESLDKHFKVHEKPSSYACDQCAKTFKSKSNLHQHQKLHLKVLPYYCKTCEKSFVVNCHYKRHLEAGKCVKPSSLICLLCNKNFSRDLLLKTHLKSHELDRPFRCDTCDMTFKYKSTLVRHMQVHKNLRPYKCKYCDKTFTAFGLIKPHLRKHTGERPYPCDICFKGFSHKQNMERHKLRHNKVKQLICEICHKQFPRESRLKYHMRTHLIDKLPFKCPLCHKCYSHRQNIQRHYKKKHPNETYECKETDASVASIIWEALKKKQQEENVYKVLPAEKDGCKVLPVENVEVKVELQESSDEEFLSEVRNRKCQNVETIIP